MKVRIGIGAASAADAPGTLGEVADAIDAHGFDSIWLSETLTGRPVDPVVGLAWLAARNPGLKLGTTMLLPGRNVVRLAKQLAALDRLSDGRLLVTFVPGLATSPEREAIGVEPRDRGARFDEVIPVLRALWRGEDVSLAGRAGRFDDVSISPLPAQDPLECWLGGTAPASLERCGRLADGWLPASCTPDEATAGKARIEAVAEAAGRHISPEHFGVSLGYSQGSPSDAVVGALLRRARGRPLDDLVAVGDDALRARLEAFVARGFSKFVVRPLDAPRSWDAELARLHAVVGDLQT